MAYRVIYIYYSMDNGHGLVIEYNYSMSLVDKKY